MSPIQITEGIFKEDISLYAYTRDLSTETTDQDVLYHIVSNEEIEEEFSNNHSRKVGVLLNNVPAQNENCLRM